MLTFKQALRRHAMFKAVVQANNRDLASEVYHGVTGTGRLDTTVSNAVADTVPKKYAALVLSDDIAAAFAATVLTEAFARERTPSTPREARLIADKGWAAFKELADAGGYQIHGLGADQSAAWPTIKALAERKIDPEVMRKIAILAGRMQVALKGARSKRAVKLPEEVVGVERGSDVLALLPTEYALLALPETEREAYRRLAESEAEQYERTGTEKKGRGPLVILQDESGSMHNDRNVWAKAAATALVREAWSEKRVCAMVHFSTATKIVVLKPGDSRGLVEMQTGFLNGGTSIATALQVGLDTVAELAKVGQRGADLVLISDGELDYGELPSIERSLDDADAASVRLFTVAIGQPYRRDSPVRKRAATYVEIADSQLNDPIGATFLAGAVQP